MNTSIEQHLRTIFRDEAAELLGELRLLVSLLRESDHAAIERHVSSAMRLAHNLKGAAAGVGLSEAERAAHALEDALLKLRELGPQALDEVLPLSSAAISAIELAAEGKGEALAGETADRLAEWVGPASSHAWSTPASAPHQGDAEAAEDAADAAPPTPQHSAEGGASSPKASTIRIETERLDRLLRFVSELLVTETDMRRRHASLVALRESLEHRPGASKEDLEKTLAAGQRTLDGLIRDNRQALGAFARLSQDVHVVMKRARMVPLESVVPSLRRVVEDAARAVHKSVDLELLLAGVELDKAVLDGLRDPLMHLLRNAVDHGIEQASARDLCGKPERGLVRVSAELVGGSVRIVVADDGGGIDLLRLSQSLVRRKLVTEAQLAELSDEALVDFVFAEGFSTREAASSLSGRGVGLDVVRRAVTELGGSVQVKCDGPLGGAAFSLTVPLSVLSTRLLLFTASDNLYAIPVEALEQVTRVPKHALKTVDGIQVVQVSKTESLRLVWLSSVVSGRVPRDRELVSLLLISVGRSRFALAVDEVLREEQMVVRRLPWNVASVPAVSGATVLADGSVALVVDAAQLATRRQAPSADPRDASSVAKVLVVDDSMTTRTLHRNVLSFAGYQVSTAQDGNDAWEHLRAQAFDAVVSDVQMPGMDGFELTRKIRSDARLKHLKVILVTSLAGPEHRRRGVEAGADDYVVKGALERDALLSAVAKQIGP